MSIGEHVKTRELAREMFNYWAAVFQVLAYPHLPLTNNEAERALRHGVILRNICHGTNNKVTWLTINRSTLGNAN